MHGNEAFLFEPLRKFLENVKTAVDITLILANTKAAQKDVRFVDQDLNRSFNQPLDIENNETHIANELLEFCNGDLIIDFHTHSGDEYFSLVSQLSPYVKSFIEFVGITKTLVLPNELPFNGSLIANTINSLSIETGKHNSSLAAQRAKDCVLFAIHFLEGRKGEQSLSTNFYDAKYFEYNLGNKEIHILNTINNFAQVKIGDPITKDIVSTKDFFPVLISRIVKPGGRMFLVCGGMHNGI